MDGDDAIPEDECWRLLATTEVGRVALSVDALPAVLPVRYVVGNGEITMCLGELQVPAPSAHEAVVAFSADELCDDRLDGWYVHAVGTSTLELVKDEDPDGFENPAERQVVRLVPTIVRGRRLHLRPPSTRR